MYLQTVYGVGIPNKTVTVTKLKTGTSTTTVTGTNGYIGTYMSAGNTYSFAGDDEYEGCTYP